MSIKKSYIVYNHFSCNKQKVPRMNKKIFIISRNFLLPFHALYAYQVKRSAIAIHTIIFQAYKKAVK